MLPGLVVINKILVIIIKHMLLPVYLRFGYPAVPNFTSDLLNRCNM
ncbi:MAG: hypothetical protein ACFS24_00725 [Candidatus Karelsulcia muelleri]